MAIRYRQSTLAAMVAWSLLNYFKASHDTEFVTTEHHISSAIVSRSTWMLHAEGARFQMVT